MRCARQPATVPNLRLKIEESCSEKQLNSIQNWTPEALVSSWATLLAPRWPKMRFGAHLGLHLDACWGASWRQDGPSWSPDGAMLANLAPRCAQEGELGAYLARFWVHLVDFFCILGAIFPKWAKTKKTTTVHHF